MKTSLKIAIGLYLLVMVGCLLTFFVQQGIVKSDHINPGRKNSGNPVPIVLKDKVSGESQEAEIIFIDGSIVTNPLRMGNEIEEHLLTLLLANLATGAMLVFLAIGVSKRAEQDSAGNG